jgi:hypothetical protein
MRKPPVPFDTLLFAQYIDERGSERVRVYLSAHIIKEFVFFGVHLVVCHWQLLQYVDANGTGSDS